MPRRVTTAKRPKKSTTTKPRARRTTTRTRKPKAAAAVETAAAVVEVEPEPVEPEPLPTPPEAVVVTRDPEPAFIARIPPPEPPRMRPSVRRGIFFDVENTSRAADITRVLGHLQIDWQGWGTEFIAVGNWRVIGHDTARLLARHGAALVHSAPSVGVRDWSDLRIAVSAGVWLAGARPGDVIEIVSDDQAFDAVGDVAASLGVTFRRTSYRAIAGLRDETPVERPVANASQRSRYGRRGSRRGGRGGRSDGRSEQRRPEPVAARPAAPPPPPPAAIGEEPHTAPHDEIVDVVRDLLRMSPSGVSLDALANALRERGFSRPPGSPRLITRLRRIKELEVTRNGTIRLRDGSEPPSAAAPPALPLQPTTSHPLEDALPGEIMLEPEDGDIEVVLPGEVESDGDSDEDAPHELEPAAENGTTAEGGQRRRRRRGGRRRRGRRGGGAAATASAEPA